MGNQFTNTEEGILNLVGETQLALAPVDIAYELGTHPNWTGKVARDLAADGQLSNVNKSHQPYYRPAGQTFTPLYPDETAAQAIKQALRESPCPLMSGTLAFNLDYNTTYVYQVCSQHSLVTNIGAENESRWTLD